MKGNYEEDQFTEQDVIRCLENAGLRFKNGHRYITTQCPLHEDRSPSAQIFKDDWFCSCLSGCGRFHITKAFPDLRQNNNAVYTPRLSKPVLRNVERRPKVTYKTFDLMDEWKEMPLIPRDHYFKNIPLEILDELGWRWDNGSYFIPYFSASKQSIPFAQWRHLSGERRFTFLKDAKPTCYGTWNLDNPKLFIVEGTSDCAVMQTCSVPFIGMPSASSTSLVVSLGEYCKKEGLELVYAGDNDSAGDKLREALDEVIHYRVKQPRAPYKDWGEMYEAEGVESVSDYCNEELIEKEFLQEYPSTPKEVSVYEMAIAMGGKELKIVDDEDVEQTLSPTMPLF